MPKLSIIIPVYNVEKYLEQCLDSILAQSIKDIEIICINDNSTDKSSKILEKYANYDKRIILINHIENKGPGKSRNDGIEIAKGEYIMFIDPDDWFENNACELAYNQIKQNNNDMVFFGFQRVYEETGTTIVDTKKLKNFLEHTDNQINLSQIQDNFLEAGYTWSQIYSREFLIKNSIRYSETYLCEDLIFVIRTIINSPTISILNQPIYNYRIRKSSLCNSLKTFWKDIFLNRYMALDIIEKSDKKSNFIYPYLIYLITSVNYWFKQISYQYPKYNKEFYIEMRNFYIEINSKYDIKKISDKINYKQFKKIINEPWKKYRITNFIKNVFEIINLDIYKIITIFGIKLKLKRKIRN